MDINLVFKALVDKEKKVVIYADANREFVDLLFCFFAKPVGSIISFISKQQEEVVEFVCMKNLLESVRNLDDQYFCTEACKTMLLSPQSAFESLKLKLPDEKPLCYFLCRTCSYNFKHPNSSNHLVSHYDTALCPCGNLMDRSIEMSRKNEVSPSNEGICIGLSNLILTDELKLVSPNTKANISLVPKNTMMDDGLIEQTLTLGSNEVLKLLKCLLTSQHPLTETFLKPTPSAQSGHQPPAAGSLHSSTRLNASNTDRKISIKLLLSKSKKMLCYAEAQEDFVNLLFSFLTLPLGYVAKKMSGSCVQIGCLDHLYNSFMQLDVKDHLKSSQHEAVLINPKLAPGYGYEDQLLDIEQAKYYDYYYQHNKCSDILTDAKSGGCQKMLAFMEPKVDRRSSTKCGGFVRPAIYAISDDLTITTYSPVSAASLLGKLKVPFDDIEERVVHIGTEEAVHLLLASFSSDCVLSNFFITPEQTQVSSELFRYQ